MKKIVTILGARPQFIKAAVLSRIISEHNEIEEVIVHTGQHFDNNMSKVFFDEMNIPEPKYNLNINNVSHGAMTGLMLQKLDEILINEKPDAVVVYGDTNSTLAGALAAKKMHIKLTHIEAGLRSFNMQMPEEINRVVTDRIADLLLCPTTVAIENVKKEALEGMANIVNSGDIMKDAVEYYSELSVKKSTILKDLNLEEDHYILSTVHRQENTTDLEVLASILKALDRINDDMKVVVPLHPRTKKIIEENKLTSSVTFIEPVGYFDMLELLKNCKLVITDSGGLQKEAFFCKKPCVVLREETEWVELIDNGFAKIAGSDEDNIVFAYKYFKTATPNFLVQLYGNNVGGTIYNEIIKLLHT